MNTLDVIIVIILSVAIVSGFWKGFIKQVFSLLGVILGYIIARKFYEPLSSMVPFADPGFRKIISFAAIFFLCIAGASITVYFVVRLLKAAELSWLDRMVGGVLGFLKGALVITIMVVIMISFLPQDSSILKGSVTLPYVLTFSHAIKSIIPQNIRENYYGKVEEITNQWMQKKVQDKSKKETGKTKNTQQ